jgi:hypothetical protein
MPTSPAYLRKPSNIESLKAAGVAANVARLVKRGGDAASRITPDQ